MSGNVLSPRIKRRLQIIFDHLAGYTLITFILLGVGAGIGIVLGATAVFYQLVVGL